MKSPPACRCRSARRRSERARDKELSPPPCATPGGRSARPRTCRCPPRPNRPSSIISAKSESPPACRCRSARRRSERARDKELSPPPCATPGGRSARPRTCRCPPRPNRPSSIISAKWNRRRRAGVVRRGAGRSHLVRVTMGVQDPHDATRSVQLEFNPRLTDIGHDVGSWRHVKHGNYFRLIILFHRPV